MVCLAACYFLLGELFAFSFLPRGFLLPQGESLGMNRGSGSTRSPALHYLRPCIIICGVHWFWCLSLFFLLFFGRPERDSGVLHSLDQSLGDIWSWMTIRFFLLISPVFPIRLLLSSPLLSPLYLIPCSFFPPHLFFDCHFFGVRPPRA